MRHNLQAILTILRQPVYAVIALVGAVLFWAFIIWVTDFEVLSGNLGGLHVTIYATLNLALALIFGVYLAVFVQHLKQFRAASVTGMVGTGAGLMVTGCASCSFTLAGLLGLGSLVVALPFAGLEFNVIGIGLIGYSIKKLTDPQKCTLKKR